MTVDSDDANGLRSAIRQQQGLDGPDQQKGPRHIIL